MRKKKKEKKTEASQSLGKHLNAHILKNYGQCKCVRIDAHGHHLFSFKLLESVFPATRL